MKTLLVTGVALALIGGPAIASAVAPNTTTQPDPSFAGYRVVKAKGAANVAKATFVVPTVTCKKNFIGVGPSVTVITKPNGTNGTVQSRAGVNVRCQQKVATYAASFIVNGEVQPLDYALSPGDKINATVSVTATRTAVDLKDVTSGLDKTLIGAGGTGGIAAIGSTETILSTATSIDPFTKTAFTNAKVNNKPIGMLSPVALQRTHGKKVQIAVSKLAKNKNFTLTFKNSK